MGLDIFFHKVKKVRESKNEQLKGINEYGELNNQRAKKRFADFAASALKKLEGAGDNSTAYAEVYNWIFPLKMAEFTIYEWQYKKMCDGVHSIAEVREFFEDFGKWYYAESDAYFRKVNFVYHFFAPKLEDECCFVTKADLEELISRCEKVMADHSLAKELLPTQNGFFFGSTDYDDWYYEDVEDCKKQMTKLLDDFDEETDVIYVIMSW